MAPVYQNLLSCLANFKNSSSSSSFEIPIIRTLLIIEDSKSPFCERYNTGTAKKLERSCLFSEVSRRLPH